jgi:UDP-4-amino-4,6-dideoxy-N-acetyl-beta-L-altrosamine transaminase
MKKIIPYGKQNITQDDIEAVVEILKSDFLTQGPKVKEFEESFANYIGAKYAIAVANGTAALHLCSLVLNVNHTTNVITTPITFSASANCVKYCGGNIFFCDIDPQTFLIDIEKLEELIVSKPEGFFDGIIPVDFAGNAVNLEKVKIIADKYNLWIIEDACHAPGGYFIDSAGTKQKCGNSNYADLAIFSFHPVKHIACGEGGMITTNNEILYKRLLSLRTHGITKDPEQMIENHGGWYMEMQELGYNYRMSDVLCALGISQLNRAKEGLKKRIEIADIYTKAFEKNKNIILPKYNDGHAFHLYIIQVDERLDLYNHLKANNIQPQVHYIPVHTMPYYLSLGFKKGDFPLSESYYSKCLSLPIYPTLSFEEQTYVINSVNNFFEK